MPLYLEDVADLREMTRDLPPVLRGRTCDLIECAGVMHLHAVGQVPDHLVASFTRQLATLLFIKAAWKLLARPTQDEVVMLDQTIDNTRLMARSAVGKDMTAPKHKKFNLTLA